MILFTYSDIAALLTDEDLKIMNIFEQRETVNELCIKEDYYANMLKRNTSKVSEKLHSFLSKMDFVDNIFTDPLCRYLTDIKIERIELTAFYADIIRLLLQTKKRSYQSLFLRGDFENLTWVLTKHFFENLLENLYYFESDSSLAPFNENLRTELKRQLSNYFNQIKTFEQNIDSKEIPTKLMNFFLEFIGLNENSKILYLTDPYPFESYLYPNEIYNTLNNPSFIIFKCQLLDIWPFDNRSPSYQIDTDDLDLFLEMIPLVDIDRINNDTILFSTPDKSELFNNNTRLKLFKGIMNHSENFNFFEICEKTQLRSISILSYIANQLDYLLTKKNVETITQDIKFTNNFMNYFIANKYTAYENSLSHYNHSVSFEYENQQLTFPFFNILSLEDRCFLVEKYLEINDLDYWHKIVNTFIQIKSKTLNFFINIYMDSITDDLSCYDLKTLTFQLDCLGDVKKFIKINDEDAKRNPSYEIFERQLYQLIKLQPYQQMDNSKEISFKFDISSFIKYYDLFPETDSENQYINENFNKLDDFILSVKLNPFSMIDHFCAHFKIANFNPEFPGLFADSSFFYNASLKLNPKRN
ncbi:hypothetical protein Q5O14_01875 [Eubacteriaceae bacterium ES2]|nr:hypothetical protein Q5O14_01875 [Eubacteriaceae bacterium ES2]